MEARAASDFSPLPRRARAPRRAPPPLRRLLRAGDRAPLRRRCSTTSSPGLTTAELRPLFAELREALVPLVAAAGDATQARDDGVFAGPFAVEDQRRARDRACSRRVGFDPDGWRLDPRRTRSRSASAPTDVRITTRYDLHDFGVALYSAPARVRPRPLRGAASRPSCCAHARSAEPVSLGVHESQSRLWENLVGRSRPFCALGAAAPAPSTSARPLDGDRRRRALPRGQPGPARR